MNAWLWIPLLSAFVGGFTNWVAVELTFHPARPRRLGPLLIQGLLLRRADRLITEFTYWLGQQGVDARLLMEAIDPKRVSEEVCAQLDEGGQALIEAGLRAVNPELWDQLRLPVRKLWLDQLRPTLPRIMAHILEAVREDPDRYIDIAALASRQVQQSPERLRDVLWVSGRRDFHLVELSGAVIGWVAGLMLAALWSIWPGAWTATIGGALVGGLTNYLALTAVFEPREPRRIGPLVLHGVVYRRQLQTVSLMVAMMLERVLTFGALMSQLLERERLRELATAAVRAEFESTAGGASVLLSMALGGNSVAEATQAIGDSIADKAPQVLGDVRFPEAVRRNIEQRLQPKLRALSSRIYGDLMRSTISQDEPLLILSGVVIGSLMGIAPLL